MLTKEDLKRALPIQLKSAATDSLAHTLNNIPVDPEVREAIKKNFIDHSTVLRDGKYKLDDYMNAVAYTTFKMMGYNNQESYSRTFPDRYNRLLSEGKTEKEISSYVAGYNKGKLVTAILEQSMIPTWLLNADVHQRAINVLADRMVNARSEMVQVTAAKALVEQLKRPDTKEVNIAIGPSADDSVDRLDEMFHKLATKQMELINSGVSTNDIAKQKLVVDGTAKDITDES